MAKRFFGFSDHSIGLDARKVVILKGAKVIEKHFTPKKKLFRSYTFYGSCRIERTR